MIGGKYEEKQNWTSMIFVENIEQEIADAIELTFSLLKFNLDPFSFVASSNIFIIMSLYVSLQ